MTLTDMSLRDMDRDLYGGRVFECAQWLVENQGWNESRKVWGYGDKVPGIGEAKKTADPVLGNRKGPLEVVRCGLITMPGGYWDNSNAQFAILGLHSAASAGIKIPRESWERVEKHFLETQNPDGGWGYQRGGSGGSMSCAGLFRGEGFGVARRTIHGRGKSKRKRQSILLSLRFGTRRGSGGHRVFGRP